MGRSYLRLEKEEYLWETTPRKLLKMIDEWKEVQKMKAYYNALAYHGKEIPGSKQAEPEIVYTNCLPAW